jgi:hypothetical protein
MGPKSPLQRHPHRNGMASLMDYDANQKVLFVSWTLEKPSHLVLIKVARTRDVSVE